jgi:hypothetical protein
MQRSHAYAIPRAIQNFGQQLFWILDSLCFCLFRDLVEDIVKEFGIVATSGFENLLFWGCALLSWYQHQNDYEIQHYILPRRPCLGSL